MLHKGWPFKFKKVQENKDDCEGATAVEFAIVSPVFFLLFLGIFELGAYMAAQTTLELAVLQVSRFGRTGDSVPGQTIQQTAQDLVNTYSFGIVDPSRLVLTVRPYNTFSSMPLRGAANNDGTQNFGSGDDAVLYTLSYDWNFFTPLVGDLLGSANRQRTIISSTIVQNEPF